MSIDGVELVGYLASALVVASLAMSSVVRLRIISLAGSVAFIVYGVLIESIPIVITNGSIAMLNVFFLRREFARGGRDLGAVVVPRDSPFLVDFLRSHEADIARFQPDVSLDDVGDFALVLTRNGLPAGVLLGDRRDDRLDVHVDHVLPEYRDSRIGRWLFGDGSAVLRDAGFDEVITRGHSDIHEAYLRRVGFEVITDEADRVVFRRRL